METFMDIQDLGFIPAEVSEPLLDAEEAPSASTQAPLSDRETAGFFRAMQEERERRQALEAELAALRNDREPSSTTLAERDLGVTVYANNLRVSRRFAEREYGREVVAAVHDWAAARCDSDPAFNARMRASDDPYEAAKQAYDQEQPLRHATPSLLDTPPPRSLATAPGNGAVGKPHVPVGDGNAYESLFK
jgi:hypothetical protein